MAFMSDSAGWLLSASIAYVGVVLVVCRFCGFNHDETSR